MQKKVEPFIQGTDHYNNNVFTDLGNNLNYNKRVYKLDDTNKSYKLG